jgi:hypothetical protein
MGNDGIMQQIRRLLSEGKTSGDVIQLGYAPGTVYKVQRQTRRRAAPAEDSPPLQGQDKESRGEDTFYLRGHLSVFPDEEERVVAVWHLEPPVACPGCGKPVEHWWMCLHCHRLLPDDCHCPPEGPTLGEGFTLRELLDGVEDRR